MIGVYYSVKADRFWIFPGMAIPQIGEYRLVCSEMLFWMESKVSEAYATTPGDKWGVAVQQFYRVRKCLESQGASEGIRAEKRF